MFKERKLISGKVYKEHKLPILKSRVDELTERGIKPMLMIITIGEDEASKSYVKNKQSTAEEIGIISHQCIFPEDIDIKILIKEIEYICSMSFVHGVIIQLPLPKRLRQYQSELLNLIPVEKDVDGLGFKQQQLLINDVNNALIPCTPKGIVDLLKFKEIILEGTDVTIIGRSHLVGMPLFHLLMNRENATVKVCHSRSNLKKSLKGSQIIISATGMIDTVNMDNLDHTSCHTLVNVGLARNEEGKMCGDISERCFDSVVWHTPYAFGGTGISTVLALMENVIDATIKQNN